MSEPVRGSPQNQGIYVPPIRRTASSRTPSSSGSPVNRPHVSSPLSVPVSVNTHFNELKLYPIIEEFIRQKGLMPRDGWTDPATRYDDRSRQFPPSLFGDQETDFRAALKDALGPHFLEIFSECSCDPEKRKNKEAGIMVNKYFECDYFSYAVEINAGFGAVAPQTAAQPRQRSRFVQDVVKATIASTKEARLSGDLDAKKAVMFEVTETADAIYKLCQLERDLALYELWRSYQRQSPVEIAVCGVGVGLAGLSKLRECVDTDDFHVIFPRIAKMKELGRFHSFSTQVLPPIHIQPPLAPPISDFVVTDGKVAFRVPVKPEHMKVMDLKKAIKEYGMFNLPAFAITVKSPDGTVLGDKDDLQPGTEYTYALPSDSNQNS